MKPVDRILKAYAEDLRPLLALARSVVCSAAEAEDVLQDVMIRIVSEPALCEKVRDPHAFLRTCVRNEAVDHVRRLGREAPTPEETLIMLRGGCAEEEYKRVEDLMWLRSYLGGVPPAEREAFIRVTLDGHTIVSAAKQLGIPPDTLRKRFNVIKKRMKRDRLL